MENDWYINWKQQWRGHKLEAQDHLREGDEDGTVANPN